MIDLVRMILEQNHFMVYTANDGQNGLSLISQVEPDLILLDLMIPDLEWVGNISKTPSYTSV